MEKNHTPEVPEARTQPDHCLTRRAMLKGGAVVLASSLFPFSIEIFNAGPGDEALAAPGTGASTGRGEEKIL